LLGEVIFSVDVEQDAPPYLNTWRGVEEGLPKLLEILGELGIRATFFVTGKCCEKFPARISEIARSGHEIGCHGYAHERLDKLPSSEQLSRIKLATKIIERVTGERPLGFRSPNFKANEQTYRILADMGYLYDSSVSVYGRTPRPEGLGLIEIQNVWPSSMLRLPPAISKPLILISARMFAPLVLDFHSWELIELSGVRWDCRFATGKTAEKRLKKLLIWMLRARGKFITMGEYARRLASSAEDSAERRFRAASKPQSI